MLHFHRFSNSSFISHCLSCSWFQYRFMNYRVLILQNQTIIVKWKTKGLNKKNANDFFWKDPIKKGYKWRKKLDDTVQPCDTTQVRSNLDFGVKSATVHVYGNSHNSQSDRWIRLNFYVDSPDMVSYYGLKFQVNRSSKRHHNTS